MRKSPAEAAKAAVERLLKQRGKLQAQLDKVDAEIAEVHGALGVQPVARPAPATATPPKPAMAGAPDSSEPKKSMGELMAEALKNPDQFKPGPRAPFIPPEERDGAPEKSLTTEGVSPADNMGAGRYI